MNTIINTAKFKADEKLEQFILDKVSKLDRLTDRATRCEVFLKIDKPESDNNKIAELQLAMPGKDLFISKQADTFEQAITEAVDAIIGSALHSKPPCRTRFAGRLSLCLSEAISAPPTPCHAPVIHLPSPSHPLLKKEKARS